MVLLEEASYVGEDRERCFFKNKESAEENQIEFLSKHFQDGEIVSNPTKTNAMKVF